MRALFVLLILACLLVRPAGAVSPKEATGAVFAAADGRGEVRLVWFPPLGKWPAGGWQVQDGTGRVLVERVAMAAPEAVQRLAEKDREAVAKLPAALRQVSAPQDAGLLYGMVGARAMGDWDYARAVGLAWALADARGRQSYRLVGLDGNGRPAGVVLNSAPIDAALATPLPPAPAMLRAEATAAGVALYWQPVAGDRLRPVLAYHVERDGAAVTAAPLVRAARWPLMTPALVDREAPREAELTYRVQAVDAFGRRGVAAEVRVYAADLAARQPPLAFAARAGADEVQLSWGRCRQCAGYVVERSLLPEGPFEALTPDGLDADTASYVDRKLRPGTAYVYRLRAMGPQGDLGPPSRTAVAQPLGDAVPPRVEGLRAEAGRTRVHLAWQPVAAAVAGYFVERRSEGGEAWARLTPRPQPEPFYDDYAVAADGGRLGYRVSAVGHDSRIGRPSGEAAVDLPDRLAPPPPHITRIDGAGGRVRIEFAPAGAAEDSRQFLVLRGETPAAEVVLGEPLAAPARQYEDGYVEAGRSYWYRLVAVDGQGNRSEPGPAVVVRVGSPALPRPPRPVVEFQAEPFPHALVRHGEPPPGLAALLQYRVAGQPWVILAGPSETAGETGQANLPAGAIEYRLVYRAADGGEGEPSEAVMLPRP